MPRSLPPPRPSPCPTAATPRWITGRPAILCILAALAAFALPAKTWAESLSGRIEGGTYASPTRVFSVDIPVHAELGGRISDDSRFVAFEDDFGTYVGIAASPLSTTLRTELATRGPKDYLAWFFTTFVMPELQRTFPGARIDGGAGRYLPGDGALLACVRLPGGSHFARLLTLVKPTDPVPVAKNGYLVFVRDGYTFVVSTELSERVTERSAYTRTAADEELLLRTRLKRILSHMYFAPPGAAASGAAP